MKTCNFILFCLIISLALCSCAKTRNESLNLNDTAVPGDQVDAQAQFEKGLMYYWGRGVQQNYEEALKWFRLSAEQRNADAQYVLGGMYYLGDGVEQDYVKAHMWFDLAAAQGNKKAKKIMVITAQKMTPKQLEKAQNLAREHDINHEIIN